jgi:pimeloyl-ACP methyl ester carboxylesterase
MDDSPLNTMNHFLPGMGADGGMYAGPWRTIPDSNFIDWPEYRGETELRQVARRVVDENDIGDGDTIVGSSLGGMIACEIATLIKPRRLILLGGVCHPDEINGLLRLMHPLANLTPFQFLGGLSASVPGELARMFTGVDAEFVRAMCLAVFRWRGLSSDAIRPVRIHGALDLVVPLPDGVDKAIPDAVHLIAMTHAEECVAWLKDAGLV